MPSSTDCRPVRVGREIDREERGKKGSGLSWGHGDRHRDGERDKEERYRDEEERVERTDWEEGEGTGPGLRK